MILEENFAILDEDEDFDLLEEEDEILMEGEILDEEVILNEIGFVKNIKGPKDIDKEASIKKIEKAKKEYNNYISSGKYRAYKSSDKKALMDALNSSEFKKTIVSGLLNGIGGAIASKSILNLCKYSLFKYEGMTMLSCYRNNPADANLRLTKSTNKLRPVGGSNYVYYILVRESDNKVILRRVSVVGMRNKASERLEEN